MGYVRTAGMSTAARRARRRAALVITSLLAGLVVVFVLAFASMQGWITFPGTGGEDDVVATTVAPPPLEPGDVAVNVFNATDTAGLAGRAGEALRARGFAVDGVANDPEGADVPGVGIIRYGPSGEEGARLLQSSLPDGVELVPVTSESDVVDLVLGDGWTDLPTADDAATSAEG